MSDTSKQVGLWSLRYSAAKGMHVVHERNVIASSADDWLRVFRQDEPDVRFAVSEERPSVAALSKAGG